MALRITERDVNGVTVVDIEGRIVLGEESNAFRERVKGLLAAGKKKIVLNLANVTYIDSSGLGTLVATFHSARSQGATLKLANLGSKFKEVLQVTKLITVFDTYDSEPAAIQSFGASPGGNFEARGPFRNGPRVPAFIRLFYSAALPSTLKIATPLRSLG